MAWQQLYHHRQGIDATGWNMRRMFADESDRFARFSLQFEQRFNNSDEDSIHLLLDYSKNLLSKDTMYLLLQLAEEAKVREWQQEMFSGQKINSTENRAVLHTALRDQRKDSQVIVDGQDVMPDIRAVLQQMKQCATSIREGAWLGYTGQRITDVVNIGIGGSDLGPVMVTEALRPYGSPNVRVHFVSNIDGTHLAETLKRVQPETTVFIIASKTFTTQETITNAQSAKAWFLKRAKEVCLGYMRSVYCIAMTCILHKIGGSCCKAFHCLID
jgi:glucose-6-phosphate isomerase